MHQNQNAIWRKNQHSVLFPLRKWKTLLSNHEKGVCLNSINDIFHGYSVRQLSEPKYVNKSVSTYVHMPLPNDNKKKQHGDRMEASIFPFVRFIYIILFVLLVGIFPADPLSIFLTVIWATPGNVVYSVWDMRIYLHLIHHTFLCDTK